ncbi:MAG: septum formation initiator family protein [Bacteroidetes bacterium]|nr:septum formation initiator family protein [Bacteroidota bacterium]
MFRKLLNILVNKYTITLVAFAIWMIFFDSYNLRTRNRYVDKLKELKEEKKFFQNEIKSDSILTIKLATDSMALEKYAREKYLMRRDKEDVYIIKDTSKRKE